MSISRPLREFAVLYAATTLALGAFACDAHALLEPGLTDGNVTALPGSTGTLTQNAAEPFGTWNGVAFTRHAGWFEGETSAGSFRVPFKIVAPDDPGAGRNVVMVEPAHFIYGTVP